MYPMTKITKDWFQIEYNYGQLGWINRNYAEVISEPAFHKAEVLEGP